ncbi:MAG: type III pantothenate kinase, partial [Bacteroidaceae bacterium]|nr:type III pantothenate kinase [Bacteroidaceae bacterium]
MKTSIADADGIRRIDAWEEYIDKADDVLVSNVAGQDALPMILQGNPKCKVLTRESAEAHNWLKQIPAGMGADRVAADIGARSIYSDRPLLVIDAGTCITFDVIDTDGTILGGAISPGIHLRLKAMHEHTAALPLLGIDGEHPVMGY